MFVCVSDCLSMSVIDIHVCVCARARKGVCMCVCARARSRAPGQPGVLERRDVPALGRLYARTPPGRGARYCGAAARVPRAPPGRQWSCTFSVSRSHFRDRVWAVRRGRVAGRSQHSAEGVAVAAARPRAPRRGAEPRGQQGGRQRAPAARGHDCRLVGRVDTTRTFRRLPGHPAGARMYACLYIYMTHTHVHTLTHAHTETHES